MTFYQGTNGRTVVLLPGRNYSVNHSVLYYALKVRKVLLRCYLELGLNSRADKLRSSGPYFWRDDSWPRDD